MFRTRLISGIILVAAALAVIITGSWLLFFVSLALSLIGAVSVSPPIDEHRDSAT